MSDTPRTDALYKAWNGEQPYPQEYVRPEYPRSVWAVCKDLERELAAALKAKEELEETHRMQLTAISVASNSNTETSLQRMRADMPRTNPYWSVAFDDVLTAMAREVVERKTKEEAERDAQRWNKLLAEVIDVYEDGTKNAPENRCYADGAFSAIMEEAKRRLDAAINEAMKK